MVQIIVYERHHKTIKLSSLTLHWAQLACEANKTLIMTPFHLLEPVWVVSPNIFQTQGGEYITTLKSTVNPLPACRDHFWLVRPTMPNYVIASEVSFRALCLLQQFISLTTYVCIEDVSLKSQ